MKRKISVICILVLLSGSYWWYHFSEKVEIEIEEPLLLLGSQALYIEESVLYARPGLVITNKPRLYIRVLIGGKVYRLYIEEEPLDD